MIDDIVIRLRELAQRHDGRNPTAMTLNEAADEIERLRGKRESGHISLSPPTAVMGAKP